MKYFDVELFYIDEKFRGLGLSVKIKDGVIKKSLTRTLEQLQKHGATIGVPLPGLPGNPMKDSLNGQRLDFPMTT